MPTSGYGHGALTGELMKLSRTPQGERNDQLNKSAFKIAQLVATHHVDQEEGYQKLYDTAREIGLADSEIRKTLNSAFGSGTGHPRQNVPEPRQPTETTVQVHGGDLDSRLGTSGPDVETSENRYDDMYLPRSALSGLPQAESWIDGVLDKRALFSITGRGGTYKSFLGLAWLASLATGRNWLGRKVTQARVLYVVGEGLYGLNARLTAWETAWSTPIPDDAFHVRRAPVNLFKRDADVSDLFQRIERERYDVILFDTLQRSSSGADTNLARDAGLIVATMGQLRDANPDMSIGYVAHLGKQEEAGTRGSTALEDDLDIVWRLTSDDDADKITARLVKRRDGPEGMSVEMQTKSIGGTDSLILESYTEMPGISLKNPKWTVPVLETLASKLAQNGLSQNRIMDAVGMSSWASMKTTADYLIEHNMAVIVGSGSRIRLKITEHGLSTLARMKVEG